MRTKLAIIILVLCAAAYMTHVPRELLEPEARELSTFPNHVGEWVSTANVVFDEATLKVLKPTDYLMRAYATSTGGSLAIYVGYHNGGPDAGPIHSPKNCLPGSGWYIDKTEEMRVGEGDKALTLIRADLAKDKEKMTCYYWYQIRGEAITNDFAMKLAELTGVLFHNRRDASFIRIDFYGAAHEKSDALVSDFLKDAYPLLIEYLPS